MQKIPVAVVALGAVTLGGHPDARAAVPKIPGVSFPTVVNELELLDFGPAARFVKQAETGGVLVTTP